VSTKDFRTPEAKTRAAAAPGPIQADWVKVRAWLLEHPDFIREDGELLADLGLWLKGGNLIEFGPAALSRLEAVAARASDAKKAIEQVARANFAAQTQAHAAVVGLLESRNHSDLARRVDAVARERFGLAAGVVALESDAGVPFGWKALEPGGIDARIGPRGLSRLGEWPMDEELFGAEAEAIHSVALARMAPWPQARPALLAFGSTEPDAFRPDMGAELVAFLARVVERTTERWPVL
jgi:uncharacterized protein YigA (DUF484 family)